MCDASVSANWCCLPLVSLVMVGMPSCRQLSGALCNFDAPNFPTAQCAQAANCPFALGSSKEHDISNRGIRADSRAFQRGRPGTHLLIV